MQPPRQHHEQRIDLDTRFAVVLVDHERYGCVLLELVQNVESAPTATAAHRVGRVGDMLQLAQHEARHQQRPGQEAGLADVGDTAVDDAAGIDDDGLSSMWRSARRLAGLLRLARPADSWKRSRLWVSSGGDPR